MGTGKRHPRARKKTSMPPWAKNIGQEQDTWGQEQAINAAGTELHGMGQERDIHGTGTVLLCDKNKTSSGYEQDVHGTGTGHLWDRNSYFDSKLTSCTNSELPMSITSSSA